MTHREYSPNKQFHLRVNRDDDGRYFWTISERTFCYNDIAFSDGHSDKDEAIEDARQEMKRLTDEASEDA